MRQQLRIGVDTGGTFTDLVALDETTGERRTVKVPSTPARPVDAVFTALEGVQATPDDVALFVLGTTIATNCLLQRRGARTLYVTTAGFEDVPFIQRINRVGLYDMHWPKPRPYVRRADCIGVRERVASDGGARVPLEAAEVERVVGLVRDAHAEDPALAVAVNLLFAYLDPAHERMLADALADALPDVPVSVSSEIAPVWREYERGNTTIVDAYLRRLVGVFADGLEEGLAARGLSCPRFLLKSNGGQIAARAASGQPVQLVLSGLAGGMIAGRHYAAAAGRADALTLDMGGTSADVGVVLGGAIRSAASFEFEFGLPIAVPVVDLTTVGAGGSSIAGFDRGGLLQVGPASAGADPGPASYGRGGTDATVTDANLVLGRLHPDSFLGGAMPLDGDLARGALQPVADRLGASLEDAARAVLRMAVLNMANAVRLVVADRGLRRAPPRPRGLRRRRPAARRRAGAGGRAGRRGGAAAPRPRVGVRRDRRRPARRSPPDHRPALGPGPRRGPRRGPAARGRRGPGGAATRGPAGRADRHRQRLAAATAARTTSATSSCRWTRATGSTSSRSSASTPPTRPRTATGCPTPSSSSCTSAPSRPTTARCRPTRRRPTARRASPTPCAPSASRSGSTRRSTSAPCSRPASASPGRP